MSNDNDLDFTGLIYINPSKYKTLSADQHTCISLAQVEARQLSVHVRVYQVDKNHFNGGIKGNIAAVGRESIVQEVDRCFVPGGLANHPCLVVHNKSDLRGDAKPGDEVVISYSDGYGRIIPVHEEAKFAYDIDLEDDAKSLSIITQYLNKASDGGRVRLTADRIAEVIGAAVTNAAKAGDPFVEFGLATPESVAVAITEHVRTLDLQQESVRVSEKMLVAFSQSYRIDLQQSTSPQEIFRGESKAPSFKQKL